MLLKQHARLHLRFALVVLIGNGFASSMKQVSGVKAEVDLDAAAPRFEF